LLKLAANRLTLPALSKKDVMRLDVGATKEGLGFYVMTGEGF